LLDVSNDYNEVYEKLCKAILPNDPLGGVVDSAQREGTANPFWRLRAEYYENMPSLLAATFSKPESEKYGQFQEMRPCIVEGSRGTGKTMLLMSLRARHLMETSKTGGKKIDQLFGFYVRLSKGSFANAGLISPRSKNATAIDRKTLQQVTESFSQEFYLSLLEGLVNEVEYCVKHGSLRIDSKVVDSLVKAIMSTIGEDPTKLASFDFDSLLNHFADMHREIGTFIKRRFIYEERNVVIPFAAFDLDCFKRLIVAVKLKVPQLKNAQMTVLLDEYENLHENQKLVVNDLVKFGPPVCSVKIAKKLGTEDTAATTTGQSLNEIHDYNRVNLVYQIEDDGELKNYLRLLAGITRNALSQQNLVVNDIENLLPGFASPQFTDEEIAIDIRNMIGATKWDKLTPEEKKTKLAYYRDASMLRLVYNKSGGGRVREYAGFRELGVLSSGVVRYFQEILGTAYHLQYSDSEPTPGTQVVISQETQCKAVYLVSEHNLTSLSRSVEIHGERLKYFLLDLGDCLRHKLLTHSSEPEAGRICIKDPELLNSEQLSDVLTILYVGIREGVFQTREGRPGMRPKHRGDPQPQEFNVSRIFAPVLQFSPRLRWRSEFRVEDFQALLNPDRRRDAMKRLFQRMNKQASGEQGNLGLGA
jgi:hypothetical protein